ncbi:hypothetical protein [Rhizobium sp. Leaf262]|uniref:hypothetical protein n=1 Tax=Rhizobium sp. Leaf262 TaxID=1736312 RepID=UPI000712CF2B|nr:hypothetical protein [Rhizobium sp. Leaf262]KQO75733.1 hypothetical protein ASF29_11055 [Rhizobium sp. Leaf262]
MAYDWSGNTVKQQRCDWVIIAALVAVAIVVIATPLALMRGTAPTSIFEATSIGASPKLAKL